MKGKVYEKRVDLAKGNPGNPLSRAELSQKFRDGAEKRLPSSKVDGLIDIIARLEELQDNKTG